MAASIGSGTPHTLSWKRTGQSRDWVLPTVVGGTTGIVAAGGTAAFLSGLQPLLSWRSAGIIVGVGAAVAGAAVGMTLLSRHLNNSLPTLPDRDDVPALPEPGMEPIGSPGDPSVIDRKLGDLYGRWTETHVVSVPDGNGGSRMETRTESHSTRWDLIPRHQAGRMDGYPTLDTAIADTAQLDLTTIYRKVDDRYLAYVADPGERWSRVDDITVTDPTVVAFVGDDGYRYFPNSAHEWSPELSREQTGLTKTEDLYREIARWKMKSASDPKTWITGRVSPAAGYETFGQALGDVIARPGEQAVMHANGRFQVVGTATSRVDENKELQALLSTEDGRDLPALEVRGSIYVPAGEYWMTRDQSVDDD